MKDFWIKTQLKIGLWQVKIKRNVKKYNDNPQYKWNSLDSFKILDYYWMT